MSGQDCHTAAPERDDANRDFGTTDLGGHSLEDYVTTVSSTSHVETTSLPYRTVMMILYVPGGVPFEPIPNEYSSLFPRGPSRERWSSSDENPSPSARVAVRMVATKSP